MDQTSDPSRYKISIENAVVFLALSVAALSPFVFTDPAPVEFALILMFFAVLARGFHRSNLPVVWLGLAHLLLVYIAVIFAASADGNVSSYQVNYTLTQTYLTLGFIALFVSFRDIPELGHKFSHIWAMAALISSLVVVILHFTISPEIIYRDEFKIRVRGFFKDPNVLGPFLAFPIVSILIYRGFNIWTRMIMILPIIFLLYLTYSRAAYAGALVALGIALAIAAVRDRKLLRAIFLIISFGIFLSAFYFDEIGSRLANAEFFFARLRLQEYDSTRFAHIALGLQEAAVAFFGLGPGEFAERHGNNPHNLFIGRLTDAGWGPAIITAFAFVAALIRTGKLAISRNYDPVILAVFSVLAAHLIISMVIHSHHWRHLWILIALGLTITPIQKNETRYRMPWK